MSNKVRIGMMLLAMSVLTIVTATLMSNIANAAWAKNCNVSLSGCMFQGECATQCYTYNRCTVYLWAAEGCPMLSGTGHCTCQGF